jgi:CHAD domain-containing protein
MKARRRRQAVEPELASGSLCVAEAIRAQQAVVVEALAHATEPGVERVHRSRVAARRLRSLLKTFGPLLEPRRTRLYRIDLRSFARAFTAVRESDVIASLLNGLAREGVGLAPADRQRLGAVLEDYREEARSTLRRHLREPGWRALERALLELSDAGPPLVDLHATDARILALVVGSWRKAMKLLKKSPASVVELHELRLALKHCRYALEAVAALAPAPAADLLRRLKAAQDGIGEHRDAIAAQHWVGLNSRSLGRLATRQLLERLEAREAALRRRAARRSAKVLPAYRRWLRATRGLRRATG